MAIKFNELMKNYEKFFDEVSTLKNKELVEFDRYLYLFDKLVDTDSSFAKLYHKIDDEVASLDSDKKILAFMLALDELGHIDVSHATFNESKKSARKSLKEKSKLRDKYWRPSVNLTHFDVNIAMFDEYNMKVLCTDIEHSVFSSDIPEYDVDKTYVYEARGNHKDIVLFVGTIDVLGWCFIAFDKYTNNMNILTYCIAGKNKSMAYLSYQEYKDEFNLNELRKIARKSLKESVETIFDFCEDMNKMWKNYDVEFIANDGVEDSVTVLIGTNHPKMVAEYIYANHFRGVKYANVGVEKNKAMLIFYHFSEHSSNEIERLAFDAITDANIRYNLFEKSRKSARKSLKESYNSEVDLMYDYEKIFKKKGWEVNRNPLKDNTLSAMHISISKNTEDGQVCFYIYCDWGVDGYGDYYSCQINDCSDAEYDYNVINYKGFEVSGRGFLLFERNQTKFCKYLEQTLNELANLKVEKVNESKKSVRKNLKEKGLRYGVDTLELIQDDIEQYIQDNNLDIQIVDNGLAKAMDVMYIYDCKGKGMKKLKSGDLMDYLFSENGMLFHNLDFGVKVSPNQITISLPKTQDYVE